MLVTWAGEAGGDKVSYKPYLLSLALETCLISTSYSMQSVLSKQRSNADRKRKVSHQSHGLIIGA